MKFTLTRVAMSAAALLTGVACNSSMTRHHDADTVSGSTTAMTPNQGATNDIDNPNSTGTTNELGNAVVGTAPVNAGARPSFTTPTLATNNKMLDQAPVIAPVPVVAAPVTGNSQTLTPAPYEAAPITRHAKILPLKHEQKHIRKTAQKHVAHRHVAAVKKAKKKTAVIAAAPKKIVRKHRRSTAAVAAPKRTVAALPATTPHTVALASGLASGANYQVIEFAPGSDQLNEGSKASLRSLIDTAKANNEIKKVNVAAWSDQAYPASKTKLSKTDRALAKRRLASINTYLKDELNVRGIADYNMAEKSNFFSRAFKTKDAELKSLFAQNGAPSTVRPEEFNIVKKEGGPEKAVILLQTKKGVIAAAKPQRTTTVAVAPIVAPVTGNSRKNVSTVSGASTSATSAIEDDNSNLDRNGYRKHADRTGMLWSDSIHPTSEELLKHE